MSILAHWTDRGHQADAMPAANDAPATYSITPYANALIQTADNVGAAGITLDFPSALSSFWLDLHFKNSSTTGTSGNRIIFFRSGTTDILGLRVASTTSNVEMVRWDGAAFTVLDTETQTTALGTSTAKYSIEVVLSDTVGVFNVYKNGSLVMSFSGDTKGTSDTTIDNVQIRGSNYSSGQAQVYNAFLADEATQDIYAQSVSLTAVVGDLDSWSGSYLDVNDLAEALPATYDASFRATGTPDNEFSQNVSDPTTPFDGAYTVVGVGVHMRAFWTTNPMNIKPLVRRGGTTALGAEVTLAGTVKTDFQMFNVDPATGVAWTYANLASLQVGAKAIAV